ncbi:molecular chaperone [Jeongeupia naejangsanensis]|uniref:Molecular chaperone n=1 Tax=Jeongeupia naejangsanensis TaxID=613195 RepID=A0ABS2BIB6_9NEIS|nr:fimbria/pilus periplasmic chaperone [Jeongeupia naejangsanensis]MBM3115346.1 molecular chaperone [Jeongeupia naejangsanensis]
MNLITKIKAGFAGLLFFTATANAAGFGVSPVRVDFSPQDRASAITVTNNGDAILRVAVSLKAWQQDAAGKDQYTPSDALVYFPRQLELAPKTSKVIRLGPKGERGAQEQAFRLYVSEQPVAGANRQGQVAMLVSFGVPVFVQPQQPAPSAKATPGVAKGRLDVRVENDGNMTLKIKQATFSDGTSVDRFDTWYLLPGVSHNYGFKLPEALCKQAKPTLTLVFDQKTLAVPLNLSAGDCKP